MGDVRPQMASLHLRIGFRHSHMELFRMIIVVKGKTKDKEKFEKKLCLFCPSPPNVICFLYLQKFEHQYRKIIINILEEEVYCNATKHLW